MKVLVVSTYELGHQPLSVATVTGLLLAAGHQVRCVDLAVGTLSADDVDWADGVALSVPMHTAMRLARRVAGAVRARRAQLPLCFFGLYAGMAGDLTLSSPADAVVAGEFEPGVVAWAGGAAPCAPVQLGRFEARVPERRLLPELGRYAHLAVAGELRLVGSVAASRGCSHRCRHCPVPVVYAGRVRAVAEEIVLADVDQLVAAGARHISFADPDFFNAPRHARRVMAGVHERHPGLSFDATIKVEHLLRYPEMLPELADAGCAFIVSAFESVNDRTLSLLDKGHTVADMSEVVIALRAHGLEVRPSWLPFTPWTTLADLVGLVDFVISHDLVANVDPVQYSVRLLVPDGSLLLAEPAMTAHLGSYDPARLGWAWAHPDPAMDRLQVDMAALVEAQIGRSPERTFAQVDALVRSYALDAPAPPARGAVSVGPRGDRARLSEPWFCCSEPTEAQLAPLAPFGTGHDP
ncbi:MAG: CUAEP/CCAEP-tail radical SAM (seleno)protein [Acidimicrobiales bacterium]